MENVTLIMNPDNYNLKVFLKQIILNKKKVCGENHFTVIIKIN